MKSKRRLIDETIEFLVVNEDTGACVRCDSNAQWRMMTAVLDAFTADKALARAVECEAVGDADSLKRAKMLRKYAERKAEIDAENLSAEIDACERAEYTHFAQNSVR